MKTISQTFKRLDRATGKWVTIIQEKEFIPRGTGKPKMRQILKPEPFLKSIFEA